MALALDIPMYGADPRHHHLGTKTGCRELFARVGVPHPLGYEDVRDPDGIVDSLARMRESRPGVAAADSTSA